MLCGYSLVGYFNLFYDVIAFSYEEIYFKSAET